MGFQLVIFSPLILTGSAWQESDLLGIDVASSSKPRKKRRKRVVVTKRHRRSWNHLNINVALCRSYTFRIYLYIVIY